MANKVQLNALRDETFAESETRKVVGLLPTERSRTVRFGLEGSTGHLVQCEGRAKHDQMG